MELTSDQIQTLQNIKEASVSARGLAAAAQAEADSLTTKIAAAVYDGVPVVEVAQVLGVSHVAVLNRVKRWKKRTRPSIIPADPYPIDERWNYAPPRVGC